MLKIDFDAAKNEKNVCERNLSFERARDFDTALERLDTRRDYRETRIVAYGMIGGRLHVLCYKPMEPGHIRIISLRKANKREEKKYEEEKEALD